MPNFNIAKKLSLFITAVLFTWIVLAGASGISPPTHELFVLGLGVAFAVLVIAVVVTGFVLGKLKSALTFFSRAYIEFLNDHLNLMFLRKVTGVGKEAIIEGCEHKDCSLPPLLKHMHARLAELREQYGGDEQEFIKIWKQESDQLISRFNKNYAFSGTTQGGGAVGLTNFSVDYACRHCSKRRENQGVPPGPLAPFEITPEELEKIIAEPRKPTKAEKTMRNVEGAFEAYKKGLKYKAVEQVFLAVAAVSVFVVIGLVLLGGSLVSTLSLTTAIFLMGGIIVLALLTIDNVLKISDHRSAIQFYFFAWELWKDEHNEVSFLKRLIGVGDETPLLESCPHLTRDNLRGLLIALNNAYVGLTKEYRKDEATFAEVWKDAFDELFNLHGLNFTFASRRVSRGQGVVRFAVVYGCRECLDKVYGKGKFDATRYLLTQQGAGEWDKKKGVWVAPPPPTTTEPEEVAY